jgi:hypothetical protein
MRWASAPRAAPKQSLETSARGCAPPRQPARRQPLGSKSKRTVSPAERERKSAPPRLSLDDLTAA